MAKFVSPTPHAIVKASILDLSWVTLYSVHSSEPTQPPTRLTYLAVNLVHAVVDQLHGVGVREQLVT